MSVSVNELSEVETNQIQVYVTMPGGSTLEATDELVDGMETKLADISARDIEAGAKIIAGTARSMGITVTE